jgi:hypothetical protein
MSSLRREAREEGSSLRLCPLAVAQLPHRERASEGSRAEDNRRASRQTGSQTVTRIMTMIEPLAMFVVYRHPKDYPDKFVVRRWDIFHGKAIPTQWVRTAESLEQIREEIPPGLARILRDPTDDPSIVECWV